MVNLRTPVIVAEDSAQNYESKQGSVVRGASKICIRVCLQVYRNRHIKNAPLGTVCVL